MQSTGNRKTWARIPAQSRVSFFHRKISNSLKLYECIQKFKSDRKLFISEFSFILRCYEKIINLSLKTFFFLVFMTLSITF